MGSRYHFVQIWRVVADVHSRDSQSIEGTVKRTPLRQVSKKRQKVNRLRRQAQEEAWGPQHTWRCWFRDRPAMILFAGPCHGSVAGHEILKRSRSGSDANLLDVNRQVPLCSFHNVWVEDNPNDANRIGLAKHSWEA